MSDVVSRRIAVLVVVGATALWLCIASLHGALGASRNDDWGYYRIAFELAATGHFAPDPYTKTMLVGQVLGSLPVIWVAGNSITALQVATALFGAIGLWAAYSLLRQFLPATWATFSVGLLAFGPLYGTLAVSFMSDVPAFALQALTLRAGYAAIRRPSLRYGWLITSMLLGLAGFTVREYAIAAPVTVLAAAWLAASGRRSRSVVLMMGAAVMVAAGAAYLWRAQLTPSGGLGQLVASLGPKDVAATTKTLFTLALLTAPAMVVVAPPVFRRRWSAARLGAWALLAAAVLWLWRRLPAPLLHNHVTPVGSYPVTLPGPHPVLFSDDVWRGVDIVALLASIILVGVLVQARRPAIASRYRTLPRAFMLTATYPAVVVAVALGVTLATKNSLFDRYLLPVVPFLVGTLVHVSGLAGRRLGTAHRAMIAAVTAAFLVFSFRIVDAASTIDGAKWRLAQSVAATGVPAQVIDGGLEWFGLHQPGPVTSLHATPEGTNFWLGLFRAPEVCFTATLAQQSGPFVGPTVATASATSLTGVTYRLEMKRVDLNCPIPAR